MLLSRSVVSKTGVDWADSNRLPQTTIRIVYILKCHRNNRRARAGHSCLFVCFFIRTGPKSDTRIEKVKGRITRAKAQKPWKTIHIVVKEKSAPWSKHMPKTTHLCAVTMSANNASCRWQLRFWRNNRLFDISTVLLLQQLQQ